MTSESTSPTAHTLACLSNKGGPGKSSISVNTAAAAAFSGARVLVIDLDQQRSATSLMLMRDPHTGTVLDALLDPANTRAHITSSDWAMFPEVEESGGVLDLLPGHSGFTDSFFTSPAAVDAGATVHSLAQAVATVAADYDLIVLDCPPSKGPVVQSALLAASRAVVVTTPEFLDVRGLAESLSFVSLFHEEAAGVGVESARVGFLVVNRVDINQTDHRAGLAEISSQVTGFPWTQVPRRAVIPRVTSQGLPLVGAEDRSAGPVADIYRSLTADVLEAADEPHLGRFVDALRGSATARRHTSLKPKRSA